MEGTKDMLLSSLLQAKQLESRQSGFGSHLFILFTSTKHHATPVWLPYGILPMGEAWCSVLNAP